MNYKEFLEILSQPDFDENTYKELINEYGSKLIYSFFSKYVCSDMSEENYEKCKYYLEDEINENNKDNNNYEGVDSQGLYLSEIGQFDLLEPEEEKELFLKLKNLRKDIEFYKDNYEIEKLIKIYNENQDKIDLIDAKKAKIIRTYLETEKEYKLLSMKLIEANLRLVIPVARRYCRNNVDFLDLIQEGNLGMHEAVERFDIEKGNKFSTYAVWWIRHHMVRSIHETSRVVRVPCYRQELMYKIIKARELHDKLYGYIPKNDKLIDFINEQVKCGGIKYSVVYKVLTVEMLNELDKDTQKVTSLHITIGEDEDTTLEDIIVDENQESVEDVVAREAIINEIGYILNLIKPRLRLVLILRYGFDLKKYMSYEDFLSCFNKFEYGNIFCKELYYKLCKVPKSYTLKEVGLIFKVTRERVRQMEFKALRLVRNKNMKEKKLQPDFLDLYK